jgi:RimJ/RimL family protein N-acetyltransferase
MSLPIEAARVRLRRFTLDDVPNVLRLSSDPSVHEAADELGSNETEAAAYIDKQNQLADFEPGALFDLAIALRDNDELIGMTTLVLGDGTAEIGYALHSNFRGNGYATEAARALVAHAFTNLGVTLVHAEIEPENRPSRAVIERLGFANVTGAIETRSPTAVAYSITAEAWTR